MQGRIDEVTVTVPRTRISTADPNGNISLNLEAIQGMPRLGGAVDLLKFLQYTPGVTATTDGDTGLYVRGSDAGQNRTLLNNAPIYSPAHLFGFFSVFNAAHLGGMTLLKSNLPAQYGSALSSVIDLRSHSRPVEEFSLQGNIGLIESDLAAAIPLASETSLFLSARHSYASWLLGLINNDETRLGYEFGDYGLTLVSRTKRLGTLILNSHFNDDRLKTAFDVYDCGGRIAWWNSASSLLLQSPINDQVSLENTLYASIYDNHLALNLTENRIDSRADLCDIGLKSLVRVQGSRWQLEAGADYAFRYLLPQRFTSSLSPTNGEDALHQRSHEGALFASLHTSPLTWLEIDLGLRLSLYTTHDYRCLNPEPRLQIAFPITPEVRLWASYNRSVQYLQLIPQSDTNFATDFYLGASAQHRPEQAHNLSLGYQHQALDGRLSWSLEAFYRRMSNVLEYDMHLSTMIAGNYTHDHYLYSGEGEAYGVEASLGYHHPQLDIQANYTWSRSLRRFEEINEGLAFPARSDRPHNLSLGLSYRPSERWEVAATFLYASGSPYTAPTAVYLSGGAILKEYGPYNGCRLPDLHRLDLSISYHFRHRGFRYSLLNLSIYNCYAHPNPLLISWAVYRDHDDEALFRIVERKHALYTIVPSISWSFHF